MKWPFRKPRLPDLPPPVEYAPAETGGAEAHERATETLAKQRAIQSDVTRVSRSLRELRERDNLALQLRLMFLGGNPHEQ